VTLVMGSTVAVAGFLSGSLHAGAGALGLIEGSATR
jgi:hypothetical protein